MAKKKRRGKKKVKMPPITFKKRASNWWRDKNPAVIFIVLFFVVMGVFYAVYTNESFKTKVHPKIVNWNASAGSAVLNLMSYNTTTSGETISSPDFTVSIKRGCDAMEPIALLVAIIIAFPIGIRKKIPGIIVGTLTLVAVNIFRVVTLFMAGLYSFDLFETMHVLVWQFIFIIITLICCAVWINWATKPNTSLL